MRAQIYYLCKKTREGGQFKLSMLRYLGCPLADFKTYIAAQFRDGMTWDNWGSVWHLDHIKPLSKFNLLDEQDKNIVLHYSNYQPLLVAENMKKSDSEQAC